MSVHALILHKLPTNRACPTAFPSPFNNTPHALARHAAACLQSLLKQRMDLQHDFFAPDGGKMMGVLVVRDTTHNLGFLAAFSGMLSQQWCVEGFVPPVFDQAQRAAFLPAGEARLLTYTQRIEALKNSPQRRALQDDLEGIRHEEKRALTALKQVHRQRKQARAAQRSHNIGQTEQRRLAYESQQDKRGYNAARDEWRQKVAQRQQAWTAFEQRLQGLRQARAALSKALQKKVFDGYALRNIQGEETTVSNLWNTATPAGGSGDCAGPKLLHAAIVQGLTPLAMAEFWWGAPPKQGLRRHAHYYPACRGKCGVILPFMLQGYPQQVAEVFGMGIAATKPVAVYEDDDIVLLNKPAGLLSVPGKSVQDSVLVRLQKRYPKASGPLLVHRLDLATSGLLLAAKTAEAHKTLQKQFIQRTVEKRYVAVLAGVLAEDSGVIDLPLRVDIHDRPRQCVCPDYGKTATTRWQALKRTATATRVHFYPITGRTHQLRLHAAHPRGLNAPIKGDKLYGDRDGRLQLHAERLCFNHPRSGKRMEVCVPAPF